MLCLDFEQFRHNGLSWFLGDPKEQFEQISNLTIAYDIVSASSDDAILKALSELFEFFRDSSEEAGRLGSLPTREIPEELSHLFCLFKH